MPRGLHITAEADARRMEAYRHGTCDADIARGEGALLSSIRAWRRSRSLPALRQRSPFRGKERMAMYLAGASDVQIARADGVNRNTVLGWRVARGLKAHKRIFSELGENERRRAMFRVGVPDASIAAAYQMTIEAVRKWRKREGLSRRLLRSPNILPDEAVERMQLYLLGKSDRAIARIQQRDFSTIRGWRTRRGLPPNGKRYPRLTDEENDRRLKIYQAKVWDAMIGRLVERVSKTIKGWRELRGLPANKYEREIAEPIRLLSLDAPGVFGGEGLYRRVADESWSDWLEESGATVW